MSIEDVLIKIGLISSEIKLYLALLELGPQGANILSKKTEIRRANVYYFLESLKEKGLVTQFSDMSGVKSFRAENPEKIVAFIEDKEKALVQQKERVEHIIPELKNVFRKKSYEIPKVRYYEGKKSVVRLYEEVFSNKEIFAIANIDAVGKIFPQYTWGLKNFLSKRKNVKMKELIVDSESAKKYQKELKTANHPIKIFDKNVDFKTDILIYNNDVAFISYRQIITAFVIEDKLIYESQINIFKELWGNIK